MCYHLRLKAISDSVPCSATSIQRPRKLFWLAGLFYIHERRRVARQLEAARAARRPLRDGSALKLEVAHRVNGRCGHTLQGHERA